MCGDPNPWIPPPTVGIIKVRKAITKGASGRQMTVQSDLRKAIAAAQQALGSYSSFAEATRDPRAKEMFAAMAHDMERHLKQLNDRLNFVSQNEPH